MTSSFRSGLQVFGFFFAVQFLYYGMLCWNYRSIAQARFVSIFVSDLACAAISFSLIKEIAKDAPKERKRLAMAGYVLGGAIGSVISVWITKQVYGQ